MKLGTSHHLHQIWLSITTDEVAKKDDQDDGAVVLCRDDYGDSSDDDDEPEDTREDMVLEDCEEEQVNSGPNILGKHQKANYDTGEVGSDEKEKEAPTNQARKGDSESKSAPPKKKFKSNIRDPAVPATNLHSSVDSNATKQRVTHTIHQASHRRVQAPHLIHNDKIRRRKDKKKDSQPREVNDDMTEQRSKYQNTIPWWKEEQQISYQKAMVILTDYKCDCEINVWESILARYKSLIHGLSK